MFMDPLLETLNGARVDHACVPVVSYVDDTYLILPLYLTRGIKKPS